MFESASDAPGDLLVRAHLVVTSLSENEVKTAMEKLALIPIASGVVTAELMQLKQDADEGFRLFAARVMGKAETCVLTIPFKCPCGITVFPDYSVEAARDVPLAGIVEKNIRRQHWVLKTFN